MREAEVRLGQGETVERSAGAPGSRSKRTTSGVVSTAGLKLDQAKRLKELERENERLKKAVS